MTSLRVGLITVALVGGSIAAALGVRSCNAHQAAAVDAAFARGLAEGGVLCAPADPLSSVDRCADLAVCRERVATLEDELDSAATCTDELANYRRTEAANRANARLLGLNDGLRIGREDWSPAQPWECPRR